MLLWNYSLLSRFSEGYFYALNIYVCLKKERGVGGVAHVFSPSTFNAEMQISSSSMLA